MAGGYGLVSGMATSESTPGQTTLPLHYGVHEYELGDCLVDKGAGRSRKLILRECPICASDPRRPRYHFGEHESRPEHIRAAHGGEV